MSSVVAIVADLNQFSHVAKLYPGSIVATPDSSVYFAAKTSGHDVTDLWSYLTEADSTRHRMLSWRFCRQMGLAKLDSYWLGSCNLVEKAQLSLFCTMLTVRNGLTAIQHVVDKVRPESMIVFGESGKINPEVLPVSDPSVFNETARYVAELNNINVVELRLPGAVENNDRGEVIRENPVSNTPLNVESIRGIRYLSVTFDLGVREQHELYRCLEDGGASEWLILGRKPPVPGLPFFPVKPLTWLSADYMGRARVNPDDVKKEAGEILSRLDDKNFPICLERFDFVWREFARLCNTAGKSFNVASLLSHVFNLDSVITGHDIYPASRCFAFGLRDAGVQVYAIDHGTTIMDELNIMYDKLDSCLLVRGRVDCDARRELRSIPAGVEIVGCLREDHVFAPVDHRLHGRRNVIVLTGKSTSGANFYGWTDCDNLYESWSAMARLMSNHPEWNFIIKCHPRFDNHEFYKQLVRNTANASVITDSTDDLYGNAFAAIMFNNATTASLLAIERQVPVIYYNSCVQHWATSPYNRVDSIPNIDDVDNLHLELKKLFSDDQYRDKILMAQRLFHREVIEEIGDTAARRVIDKVTHSPRSIKNNSKGGADMLAVLFISIARAFLSCGLSVSEYISRLMSLPRAPGDLDQVSGRHQAVFNYIMWGDDVGAGKYRRIVALFLARLFVPEFSKMSGFKLKNGVLALMRE